MKQKAVFILQTFATRKFYLAKFVIPIGIETCLFICSKMCSIEFHNHFFFLNRNKVMKEDASIKNIAKG
jgi:hypothetical protein